MSVKLSMLRRAALWSAKTTNENSIPSTNSRNFGMTLSSKQHQSFAYKGYSRPLLGLIRVPNKSKAAMRLMLSTASNALNATSGLIKIGIYFKGKIFDSLKGPFYGASIKASFSLNYFLAISCSVGPFA
jgi:hypothetical protein